MSILNKTYLKLKTPPQMINYFYGAPISRFLPTAFTVADSDGRAAADFSKHNEATTNKFSRLLFILKHVKTVPNGRLLLLSSACRSKKYPLYRLAINSLKLLERKHCEMHPSWLSFAVKLTAFFGYFLLL